LGRTDRQELIDELQYWNNALKNCFEKQEIPSDESDRTVQELQARFNPKQCDATRENARLIHEALESSWNCVCSHAHRGNLNLDWHCEKPLAPAVFSLALSYWKASDEIMSKKDEHWHKVRVQVEEQDTQQDATATLQPAMANLTITPNRSPSPSKRAKFAQLFTPSKTKLPSKPSTLTPPGK
jgi:hypothetical protein